jgi:hypothetical protein
MDSKSISLKFIPSIPTYQSYTLDGFKFLNLEKTFTSAIDWNYSEHGKLWTYNLTYFDFLNQNNISKDDGLKLIHDFISQSTNLKDAIEPFPISLRGINWIKFITKFDIQNQTVDDSLNAQYSILLDNLEYHLLGNHLLENGFSLLFGAYYFQDEALYAMANKILTYELNEQILLDGAHFELSPMYHQIMLFRVLDCINLIKNNVWKKRELLSLLESKAEIMLGWLNTISYADGSIPLLNDSANGIAPTSEELIKYAESLDIHAKQILLKESGYRKVVKENYECIIDIGNIGPDYILGHAHSDTFNFELHIEGRPIIVDTGLSTYETNKRRNTERSTSSHNTVMVNNKEQSEIWGGFRVGKRAKVIYLREETDLIEAIHDGFKSIGVFHNRIFKFNKNCILIHDIITNSKEHNSIAFLHFHPDVIPNLQNNVIEVQAYTIMFSGHSKIEMFTYEYASEFNKKDDAYGVKISFSNSLETSIILSKETL